MQPDSSSVPQPPIVTPYPGGHSFDTQSSPRDPETGYDSPYEQTWGTDPSPHAPYGGPSLDQFQPGMTWNDFSFDTCVTCPGWQWTLMPKDLLYHSYLGAPREPRLGQTPLYLDGQGWIWELEAGGRVGLLRYGTKREIENEGWQLDVWGAAFPRLNFKHNLDLDAVDFKVGVPLTWRKGRFQAKIEGYHISSHAGDEYLLRNPGFNRIDYLRDSIVLGGGYFPDPDLRLYAEVDYAINTNGGAKPWHFQFGVDYSPICKTGSNHPQPFLAVNGLLREELNFSGGVNMVAGWQWRSDETQGLFRIGVQYYNGSSLQMAFLDEHEELVGFGMWYDF